MTTAKAWILTGAILATIVFIVLGARAISKNKKVQVRIPGEPVNNRVYTFKEIVASITNQS